jgi:hypothetical protein
MKILLDTHRFRRAGIGVQPVGAPQRDWAGRVRTQVIIAQNSQATPVTYDPDQYVLPRGCTLETMRPQKFSE